MVTKRDRQEALTGLVRTGRMTTQDRLIRELRRRGMVVDQSTLSRDLAELGIHKSAGRYLLVLPTPIKQPPLAASVIGFTTCGPHMIVMRTTTGQAQPVGVAIDSAGEPAVAGTLAGDDTVFVATKNRRCQSVVLRRLEQWFGDKHER